MVLSLSREAGSLCAPEPMARLPSCYVLALVRPRNFTHSELKRNLIWRLAKTCTITRRSISNTVPHLNWWLGWWTLLLGAEFYSPSRPLPNFAASIALSLMICIYFQLEASSRIQRVVGNSCYL